MKDTYGEKVQITIFGESHGPAIGAVIDGLPAGICLDTERIRKEMDRRAPGRDTLSTQRKESDAFFIQSGVFQGRTTGTALCVLIPNSGQHSGDYEDLRHLMRPGHGDYTGRVKYQGYNDYRGGGHFSGRLTAPLVFAGAIVSQWLEERGILVSAHIRRIGQIEDIPFDPMGEPVDKLKTLKEMALPVLDAPKAKEMEENILCALKEGDSVGGIIECMAVGLPAGLGDPFFDSVESRLSHAIFSIPAVKGIEFGSGFSFAGLRGSEANDAFCMDGKTVKTKTNRSGGILGGITDGMPLLYRAVIKPTASIAKPQETVDMDTMSDTVLRIRGRHDPCIVKRAVPVLEAVTAWTIMDMMLSEGKETDGK